MKINSLNLYVCLIVTKTLQQMISEEALHSEHVEHQPQKKLILYDKLVLGS